MPSPRLPPLKMFDSVIDEAQVVGLLAARELAPDVRQRHAIAALIALLRTRRWRDRLCGRKAARGNQGVYCHGRPGRGKSLVVDTVFELATCTKRRIHFHEFLREMNRRLAEEPHGDDRLGAASRRWLTGVALLCFDEFPVHDIADAFLISRFLDIALKLGTRIVLTSNYAPHMLLPNREFHQMFLATIERIERHFTVIHFDGARDYRLSAACAERLRFFAPIDATSSEALRGLFLHYEEDENLLQRTLAAAGRPLSVRATGQDLAWIDFDELCVSNRSYLDYLDIAERWRGLIVDHVLTHKLETPQTLQRFVWLIEILYDRKRALFIASDQPLVQALSGLEGAHDLSRTLSRLADMQSRAYINTLGDGDRLKD